ncbi:DASH family cryptochrome [Neiella sp. HB171785]|uniref:Cryptochrome DASH n=1 Tax=Neiella litorisoli TaxID=2771431 RepID=A0A8J6UMG3_9GAMM|nr:DASH family cryptochrome [Neiella litorisoli]MBD1390780.1 DASH family cryptochrome [Neiella litorisoli]
MNRKTSLIWFSHDLRIDDNPILHMAAHSDALVCVFFVEPEWFQPIATSQPSGPRIGPHRWRFLQQALVDLSEQLTSLGQRLLVVFGSPQQALPPLLQRFSVNRVLRSTHATSYEQRQWQQLRDAHCQIEWLQIDSHDLFQPQQLPFARDQLPTSFSKFRKLVEPLPIAAPLEPPACLPWSPLDQQAVKQAAAELPQVQPLPHQDSDWLQLIGGERSGLAHLARYFDSEMPLCYKQVRNELDGWQHSTKLSPWLALGCISVRRVVAVLKQYEQRFEANESTYWIYFELLWREYFHCYAKRYGNRIFQFRGLRDARPLTSFYPQRFRQWSQGQTQYPLVNACIKQLNATGYMSNRGRQIVASCLVNEMQVDWRYGAAYFEYQLVDYDPAVNWGNWQYIAGVGADPRGGRHFNIEKQQQQYDPDGDYIRRWQGQVVNAACDAVDGADWPTYS